MSKLPCKETVTEYSSIEETFLPIAENNSQEEVKCSRIIILCRNYKDYADLYFFFFFLKNKLGSKFTYPPRAPDLTGIRVVLRRQSKTKYRIYLPGSQLCMLQLHIAFFFRCRLSWCLTGGQFWLSKRH